jgi:hypothetical protein
MGLEGFVLPIIQQVIGGYIKDRLTTRQSSSSRAELISMIESQLTDARILEQRVQAIEVAIRELDHLVRTDKDLAWQNDELVIQPIGRVRKVMPTPEDALSRLSENIATRRAALDLPTAGSNTRTDLPQHDGSLQEGDLIPPTPKSEKSDIDWQLRLASLPSQVLRERERRTRDSDK